MTEKLNLPELPEGQFWRVHYIGSLLPMAEVQLREKRKRFGSRVLDETQTTKELTPENVVRLAKHILARRADRAKAESLLGDYPPKRLELQ